MAPEGATGTVPLATPWQPHPGNPKRRCDSRAYPHAQWSQLHTVELASFRMNSPTTKLLPQAVVVGSSLCHINCHLPNSFRLNIIGHTHNDGESPARRGTQRVRPRLEGAYSRAEGSRFPSARKNIAGWQFRRQPPIQGRETERGTVPSKVVPRSSSFAPARGGLFFCKTTRPDGKAEEEL